MERVVLVTGATDGIGRASARELAGAGFYVLVHGRRRWKVDAVVAELRGAGHGADGFVADFARLDDVRRLSSEVESGGSLHVLLANAGVYMPERVVTADGHEMTLQVNHLAHALLALLLLPALRRAAPARILLTSSVAHLSADLDLDDLDSERAYSPYGVRPLEALPHPVRPRARAPPRRDRRHRERIPPGRHRDEVACRGLRRGYGRSAGGGGPARTPSRDGSAARQSLGAILRARPGHRAGTTGARRRPRGGAPGPDSGARRRPPSRLEPAADAP